MRLPNRAHTIQPWRIHELTPDFRVEDVWELPTPGGPEDFPRLVELVTSLDPERGSSGAVRALCAIRWKVGELLGWDDPEAGLGSRVPTLRDRLPADLRDAPSAPGTDALPFSPLYLIDDEWAAEIANRTMHGTPPPRVGPRRDGRLPRPADRPRATQRPARMRVHGRDHAVPAPDRVPGDAARAGAGVARGQPGRCVTTACTSALNASRSAASGVTTSGRRARKRTSV